MLTFYTDGSSLGNPGPGGCAWILVEKGFVKKTFSSGAQHVTNNRMETYAFLEVIKYIIENNLNHEQVHIVSDSQICVNTLNIWLKNWVSQGILNSKKNNDLWKWINDVISSYGLTVTSEWVKAHNGNEFNEYADQLATTEAKRWRTHLAQ